MYQPFQALNVLPTVTATTYATGKVIGGIQTIPGAFLHSGSISNLISLALLDNSNSKQAIDVLFFDSLVSPGADTATFSITAAESKHWLGGISILTTDYISNGSATAIATKLLTGLMLKAAAGVSNVVSKTLYMVLVSRGSVVLATTSDIQVKLGLIQG